MSTMKTPSFKKNETLQFTWMFICFFCLSIKGYSTNKSNTIAFIDTLENNKTKQTAAEWEILFDGKNVSRWVSATSDKFPSKGWEVKDETLFSNRKGGGDIITREKYSDFELMLDFKLTDTANSGIKYFVDKVKNKETGKTGMNGLEYQIIDDYNHPEVSDHKYEKGATASLYLIYEAKNKTLRPTGQWNQIKIVAKGDLVEHWLNGVKVLNYIRGSKDFRDRMALTKFRVYENYGELAEGHILLTDHGDTVYFRNIKIRRL